MGKLCSYDGFIYYTPPTPPQKKKEKWFAKNLHIANDLASLVQQQVQEADDQISYYFSCGNWMELNFDATQELKI